MAPFGTRGSAVHRSHDVGSFAKFASFSHFAGVSLVGSAGLGESIATLPGVFNAKNVIQDRMKPCWKRLRDRRGPDGDRVESFGTRQWLSSSGLRIILAIFVFVEPDAKRLARQDLGLRDRAG